MVESLLGGIKAGMASRPSATSHMCTDTTATSDRRCDKSSRNWWNLLSDSSARTIQIGPRLLWLPQSEDTDTVFYNKCRHESQQIFYPTRHYIHQCCTWKSELDNVENALTYVHLAITDTVTWGPESGNPPACAGFAGLLPQCVPVSQYHPHIARLTPRCSCEDP